MEFDYVLLYVRKTATTNSPDHDTQTSCGLRSPLERCSPARSVGCNTGAGISRTWGSVSAPPPHTRLRIGRSSGSSKCVLGTACLGARQGSLSASELRTCGTPPARLDAGSLSHAAPDDLAAHSTRSRLTGTDKGENAPPWVSCTDYSNIGSTFHMVLIRE